VRRAVPRGYRHGAHMSYPLSGFPSICTENVENGDGLPRHLLLPLLPQGLPPG